MGVGVPHLGTPGRRTWPRTWEGPWTFYISTLNNETKQQALGEESVCCFVLLNWYWGINVLSFFLSFLGFRRPNLITGLSDGKHPISHLGPKNLSRTGGPGPDHYLVYGRPNQTIFSLDQVLAWTESAVSEYSTMSQCLNALLGRPGRVKFIQNGLRWKKKIQRTYHSYTTTAWRLSTLRYNQRGSY